MENSIKVLWIIGRITARIFLLLFSLLVLGILALPSSVSTFDFLLALIVGYFIGIVVNQLLFKIQHSHKRLEGLMYLYTYLFFVANWFFYANDFQNRVMEITLALCVGLFLATIFTAILNRSLKPILSKYSNPPVRYNKDTFKNSDPSTLSASDYRFKLSEKNSRKITLLLLSASFILIMTHLSPSPIYFVYWLIGTMISMLVGLKLYRNHVYKRFQQHTELKLKGKTYNQRYIDLYKERSPFWSGWNDDANDTRTTSISHSNPSFPSDVKKEAWRLELEKIEELEDRSRQMRAFGHEGQYDAELDEIDHELGRGLLEREYEDEFHEYKRDIER